MLIELRGALRANCVTELARPLRQGSAGPMGCPPITGHHHPMRLALSKPQPLSRDQRVCEHARHLFKQTLRVVTGLLCNRHKAHIYTHPCTHTHILITARQRRQRKSPSGQVEHSTRKKGWRVCISLKSHHIVGIPLERGCMTLNRWPGPGPGPRTCVFIGFKSRRTGELEKDCAHSGALRCGCVYTWRERVIQRRTRVDTWIWGCCRR